MESIKDAFNNKINQKFSNSNAVNSIHCNSTTNYSNQSISSPRLTLDNFGKVYLRRVVTHPLGHRTNIPINTALSESSSRDSFWNRTIGDARVYMFNCVKETTQKTDQTGWTHYLRFIELFGTNELATKKPSEWLLHSELHCYSFLETVVMAFLAYLRSDVRVEPQSAIHYVSACRFYWLNSNVDIRVLDNSVALKAQRAGMNNVWRALEGNKVADRVSMPFNVQMIQYMANVEYPDHCVDDLINHATVVATKCGYLILGRPSEYLLTPLSDHHIRGCDVKWILIINGVQSIIDASQAYKYSINNVTEMILTVRGAKNDREGVGNRFNYRKVDLTLDPSKTAFCICSDMFFFASRARPLSKAPFFSSSIENWSLTAAVLNVAIKEVAEIGFRMDSARFSTRSLRVGGASALAAAGVPDYIIQKIGRWKSLTFLQYIRLAHGAFELALIKLIDPSNFTVKDTMLWHPGAITFQRDVVPEEYAPV